MPGAPAVENQGMVFGRRRVLICSGQGVNLCKNFLQMFYLFKWARGVYDKTCKNERNQSAWKEIGWR